MFFLNGDITSLLSIPVYNSFVGGIHLKRISFKLFLVLFHELNFSRFYFAVILKTVID